MEGVSRVAGLGLELLNQSNYRIWKTCMESYFVGEGLWDVVVVGGVAAPENVAANAEALKKWKQLNAKAEFVLKRSISHGLFEHIIGCGSAREIWQTLDRLFNKRNEARLQMLENELAAAKQTGPISEYFLKVKNLCSEISLLNPEERISEARTKRYIIRGLLPEYTPFITSIQGWTQQPSLEELENLLSSQESLAMQMVGTSIKEESNSASFVKKGSAHRGKGKMDEATSEHSNVPKKSFKCYRCGKLGHIRKNCRVKLKSGNFASSSDSTKKFDQQKEEDWNACFHVDLTNSEGEQAAEKITRETCLAAEGASRRKQSITKEWIVDSGCGHHITGDESTFSLSRVYNNGSGIVTADNTVHQIQKEGTVIIDNDHGESITLNSVYYVPGIRKNLFSVANAVDAGNFVLFGPEDVKFLRNVKEIKADVIHTGTRVNDLFVLSASNSYIEKMSSNNTTSLWHARLGHLCMAKLKVMAQKKLVDVLPEVLKLEDQGVCQGCQFGKAHRLPFDNSSSRCKTPLERIHSDLMGPTRTASYSGYTYMLLFVDDYTRFTWVYFVKHKSEVFSRFLEFKETVEGELCRKIRVLRTDNGGEFCSNEFLSYCRKNGIKREFSCPETPQQNGIAERKIRHLVETWKSWLHMKNLPKELWAEGMRCAAHVINRVPLSPINFKSPFEMLFDVKPSVKYFRVFGSICYVHIPDSRRSKLDAKAMKCIFIGYDEGRKGWRCLDPTTFKYVVSRDVVFDEISSYYSKDASVQESDTITLPLSHSLEGSSEEDHGERGSFVSPRDDSPEEETRSQRPRRNIVKPSRFRDDNFVTTFSCFLANPVDDEEPSSYDEARGVKEWEAAMKEEMDALQTNQTWDLVSKPPDVQPVSCKWVFRIKRKTDGSIDRYKARLVARGFSQKYGEDYEETFSPVAKMTSVRIVLALAACFGWKLWQLDVKNAFLYGELDRPIYMDQPPGFVVEDRPNLVCKLKKALYGLKQAPRAWYGKIAEYLRFCGYVASESDSSLFIKKRQGLMVIVLLYVDDIILTGSNYVEISCLQDELSLRFDMKKL